MSIKKIAFGFLATAGLAGVLAFTPVGVTAQTTIRNTFVTPVVTAATTYLTVRLTDGSAFLTPGTDYTHDAALTVASTAGPMSMGRASAAAPTDVTADNDAVMSWFLRSGAQVTQPSFAGTPAVGGSGVNGAGVQRVTIATDQTVAVSLASVPSHAVTNAGTFATQASPTAATTGGADNYTFLSTAAVISAAVKAAPGTVYDMQCFNVGAAAVYVRLYNLTTAPATTDTPVWRGIVPGATTGAGYTMSIPVGRAFGTGVGIRVTAAVADNDATALAANQVICNVGYK